MKEGFDTRLSAVAAAGGSLLCGGLKGIEKESLRVTDSGDLSLRPHPVPLGSALTNRYITTDFSEALLEFVTPALSTTWEALQCICDIHQFTYSVLQDEMLWAASMPCRIPEDASIPLARYGSSNVGQMKTIYRRGLGYRYGRQMQTIAGVHFNYSVPVDLWIPYQRILGDTQSLDDFRSAQYLGLIRNFKRLGWLVLYLFGASPALCKSFAGGKAANLASLNGDTYYGPYATSLRMSDLGYSNKNQSRLNISLNSLSDYVDGLSNAIETPEPSYEQIGVKVDGKYRQLNTNLLQIENEFYSSVRPKRVANSGEQPTAALRRGGIEYVEIRSLDINLFDPCGINQNTMRFMEAFLLYCLLEDSAPLDRDDLTELDDNQARMAKYGRDPTFQLQRTRQSISVLEWGSEVLERVAHVAAELDKSQETTSYAEALLVMQNLLKHPEATPSARIVDELQGAGTSFFDLALQVSKGHRDYFATLESTRQSTFDVFLCEATDSLLRQKAIEDQDDIDLDEYLAEYFARD